MAHAIFELSMAINDLSTLHANGAQVSRPWWLALAQRQPIRLPHGLSKVLACLGRDVEEPVADSTPWTLTHSYFANKGGFSVNVRERVGPSPAQQSFPPAPFSWDSYKPLTASQLAERWSRHTAVKNSEAELADKCKTDYLSKAVAVVQIAQLVLSVIVRRFLHLEISQLEVLTLAFAVCGVLTYAAYWYRRVWGFRSVSSCLVCRQNRTNSGLY